MPLGIEVADRIKRICSYVRNDEPLYDLCCDHGLIGIYALETYRTPEVYLVDRSPRVISVLKDRCGAYLSGDGSRHIICQDAKNLHIPHKRATIVIAGVGGKTIESILQGIDPENSSDFRLILAPLKTAIPLRRFLRMRQWKVREEELMVEKGRFRELLVLERQGEPVTDFGQRFWQSAQAASYLQFLERHYRRHRAKNPRFDQEALAFENFCQNLPHHLRKRNLD